MDVVAVLVEATTEAVDAWGTDVVAAEVEGTGAGLAAWAPVTCKLEKTKKLHQAKFEK